MKLSYFGAHCWVTYPIFPLSPVLELWCKLDALIRTRNRMLIVALSQQNTSATTKSKALVMTSEWCQTTRHLRTLTNDVHLTVARLKKKHPLHFSASVLQHVHTHAVIHAAPEQQSVPVTLSRHAAAAVTGDTTTFLFCDTQKRLPLGLLKVEFDFYCRGNNKSRRTGSPLCDMCRGELSRDSGRVFNCPLLSFLFTDRALCRRWVVHRSPPPSSSIHLQMHSCAAWISVTFWPCKSHAYVWL